MPSASHRVKYQDGKGRWYVVELPLDDDDPAHGIIIGPWFLPDLEGMLPEETATRLHNELFNRGIITEADARRRLTDVIGALNAAYRVDAMRVMEAYRGGVNGVAAGPSDGLHARVDRGRRRRSGPAV